MVQFSVHSVFYRKRIIARYRRTRAAALASLRHLAPKEGAMTELPEGYRVVNGSLREDGLAMPIAYVNGLGYLIIGRVHKKHFPALAAFLQGAR